MHRRSLTAASSNESVRKRGKKGFALVLALGLTSFLLLLLLALTTLSRLGIEINEAHAHRLQARQNALLGLHIALGELQKLAGPDRRVTARADILGENLENPYWTGVWSTEEINQEPAWLVSGIDADPVVNRTGIKLAKSATGNKKVTVVSVPILRGDSPDGLSLPSSSGLGHYAYWISDEGVKSSLAKTDRVKELSEESYNEQYRKHLRQLSPVRHRREVFFTTLVNEDAEGIREGLLKTTDYGQIANVPGFSGDELKGAFFGATHLSFGVLSNAADGGLKRDLSASDIHDSEFPFLASLKRASEQRINQEGFVEYPGGGQPATENSGDYLNAPSPLITEFALFAGIFKNSLESDFFRLEFGCWLELWNPYSFPMSFDLETENDLVIKISGLPVIQVDWEANRGQNNNRIGSFSIDLNAFQDEFVVNFGIPLAEGEVKTRIARANHVLEQSLPSGTVNNPAKNLVTISAPASILTIQYFNASGQLLREVKGLRYEAFNTPVYGLSRNASPSRTNPKHFQHAFHYKLLDNPFSLVEGQKSDMEKWLSDLDFRSSLLNPGNNLLHASLIGLTVDPAALHFVVFFDDTDLLDDGSGNYFRIFDFPAIDPVSVGSLQHLQVLQDRPFSIGNPWGDSHNAVFDRYFFSTVPTEDATWNPLERLSNSFVKVHDYSDNTTLEEKLKGQFSSRNLLVEGAFNMNSTSVEAWQAILSGIHLENWTYRFDDFSFTEPLPPITRPSVKNGFFRLSHGADRQFSHPFEEYPQYPEIRPQEKKDWYKRPQQDWKNAYRSGMRELTAKEVKDMAEEIVRLLREKANPFISMEQFVNSALLQRSINATTINTVDGSNYDSTLSANSIPFNAPSFLTQADILSSVAPFVQLRSDTFLIRAYGDVYNPIIQQTQGRAWCEALVQRVPEPVEFRDRTNTDLVAEDYNNPPGKFGRRFKIVHFRWLDSEDI